MQQDNKSRQEQYARAEKIYLDAVQNYKAGKIDAAIVLFMEAGKLARALNEPEAEASALNDTGACYAALGQNQKAVAAYEHALEIRHKIADRRGEASTLVNLALLFRKMEDFEKASNYLLDCCAICKFLGDPRFEAAIWNDAGACLTDAGRAREALDCLEKALSLFGKLSDQNSTGQVLNNKGKAYSFLWKRKEAEECWDTALSIFDKLGDRTRAAIVQTSLGNHYYQGGELKRALDILCSAISFLRTLGPIEMKSILAGALNNLGLVHVGLGNPQMAVGCFQESSDLRRDIKDHIGEARTLNSLGLIFNDVFNDPDRAISYYQQAMTILGQYPDDRGRALVLNNIGLVCLNNGDYDKALESFLESYDLKRSMGDLGDMAHSKDNIGRVYYNRRAYEKAIETYQEVIEIEQRLGDRTFLAFALSGIAAIRLAQGQQKEAYELYSQALSIHKEIGDRLHEAQDLHNLGCVAALLGLKHDGEQKFQNAIEIFESIQGTILDDATRSIFQGHIHQTYREMVGLLLRDYDAKVDNEVVIQSAFEFAERGRARGLLYMLRDARAHIRSGADPGLLEEEQELLSLITSRVQRSIQLKSKPPSKQDKEQIQLIGEELSRLQERYERVQERIKLNNPRYAGLLQPAIAGIKEIQDRLQDGKRILLEYVMGDEQSYMFLIGGHESKVFFLPPERKINSWINDLLKEVHNPKAGSYPYAYQLFEALVKPAEPYIQGKELIIIPDGLLHQLPFELLQTDQVEEVQGLKSGLTDFAPLPFLIKRQSIRYSSSATSIFDQGLKPPSDRINRKSFAGAAPVDFDFLAGDDEKKWFFTPKTHFPPLTYSQDEVTGIYDLFGAKDSLKFLKNAATKEILAHQEVTTSRFLHFATHGLADESRPFFSGLILTPSSNADDGFLSACDILRLNLDVDMAVLSACETGLGKMVRGEGLVGLSQSFIFAGARKLLVSLWRVDDFASAELMKKFYSFLSQEEPLDEADALREAKLNLLEKAAANQNLHYLAEPYYWAPFVLIG